MKHFFTILTILLISTHGDDDGVEIPKRKVGVTEIKVDVTETKAEVTKTKVDVTETKAEVTEIKPIKNVTEIEAEVTDYEVSEAPIKNVAEIKPIKNVTEIEAEVTDYEVSEAPINVAGIEVEVAGIEVEVAEIEVDYEVSEAPINVAGIEVEVAEIEVEVAEIEVEVPDYEVSEALKKGERYSFESYNFPGYFIRPEHFLGEITKINSLWDKKDASFEVVPGLADNRYISFESLNRPGYFLRHQGFRLKLGKSSNDQGFKKDATFKVKPGLAFDSLVSFESLNYSGRYIRHRDFHLYLEKGNDNLFRKDATFRSNPASIWMEAPTSFTYIGNFPKNLSIKIYDNIQGITHDDDNWYISKKNTVGKVGKNHARLYKFDASDNLYDGDPVISKKLEGYGYGDHPGDITYFKRDGAEYIFVPIYKEDSTSKSRILVFRASDLELVVASNGYNTIDKPSWVALDPSGRLYHNNHNIEPKSGKRIQVYDVDWNKIANKDPSFLTHLREFPLYHEDGTEFATIKIWQPGIPFEIPCNELDAQQGAAFSPNGNLFFMSQGHSSTPASLSGIKVFDAQTGHIIFRSDTKDMPFKFEFYPSWPYKWEEPQGLTVWDLDDPNALNAPNISGQLHVIMIRNDEVSHDDLYIKHYRVPYEERCRLSDINPVFSGTVRDDWFHEGVRGATLTFVSENGQVSKTTQSQIDGKYVITLPKLGRYSVEIRHPDYDTLSDKWHVLNECGNQPIKFRLHMNDIKREQREGRELQSEGKYPR